MVRLRAAGRWLTDYRTGLTFLASVLVALLAVTVFDSITSRDRALDAAKLALTARDRTARDAARQTDLLSRQIGDLQGQLRDAAGQRAKLDVDVAALTAQIEQLCRGHAGCAPIVAAAPPTTAAQPRSSPPAATSPTLPTPPTTAPPAQPQPPPSTTTTTMCQATVLGRCVVP